MNRKSKNRSAGARFRAAVAVERPLQIVGCINAYSAILAESVGFRALYLSGGGVAAASLGVPDLGIITLDDVLTDVRRITDATDLPLLVDVDTGFGNELNIARTVKSLIKFGAAAMHIEDQVMAKRCGHRKGKAVVPPEEMVDRIKAAVDARTDPQFFVIARTDAIAVEDLERAIDRALVYVEAGADGIFPEAVTDLSSYRRFAKAIKIPVLANMTEFGVTPLYTLRELKKVGVSLVLYPLSAFRAASAASLKIYEALRTHGTQKSAIGDMQSRDELYKYLGYHFSEKKMDQHLSSLSKSEGSRSK